MNLLDVAVVDGGVQLGTGTYPVARDHLKDAHGQSVTMGVRPEDLDLTTEGHGIPVVVDVVEELGADAYIYGTAKDATQHQDFDESGAEIPEKPFIARVDGRRPPAKGETVYLAPKEGHVHMFDAENGQRLGD